MIGGSYIKSRKNLQKIMLKEMGIRKWFNTVCGMDEHDDLDKAGLIKKCCSFVE